MGWWRNPSPHHWTKCGMWRLISWASPICSQLRLWRGRIECLAAHARWPTFLAARTRIPRNGRSRSWWRSTPMNMSSPTSFWRTTPEWSLATTPHSRYTSTHTVAPHSIHLQIGLKLPAFLDLVMIFESACVLDHSLFEYLAGPSIVLTFESRMVDKL